MLKKKLLIGLIIIISLSLGSMPFFAEAKTDIIEISQCNYNIQVSIAFDFEDSIINTETLINTWHKGMSEIWNDPDASKNFTIGCNANFDFNLIEVAQDKKCLDYPDYHCIKIVASEYNGRGNTADATLVLPNTDKNSWGEWSSRVNEYQAAHEAGHMMGLGEDYHYDLINGEELWVNDNYQSSGPQSIMAQTWDDVAALSEHTYQIIEQAGFELPAFVINENSKFLINIEKNIISLDKAAFYPSPTGQIIYTDRINPKELAGKLIKGESDSAVYLVDSNGKLRWVSNEKVAIEKFGNNWSSHIIWFNDSIIFTYQFDDPV